MYHILWIFAKLTLLGVFLLSTQAGAEQLLVIAADERGANSPSAPAAQGQAAVPGYSRPMSSAAKNPPAEPETNGTLWLPLLGEQESAWRFSGWGAVPGRLRRRLICPVMLFRRNACRMRTGR